MLGRKILFFGAQGTGKSTLLNSVAGSIISQSKSPADGIALTKELQHKNVGNITYCDTPGLTCSWYKDTNGDKHRHNEEAAAATSNLLKEGGVCKLLFVVNVLSTNYGAWIAPEDNATMRLILEAAPEIGNRFGVIVNNCPEKEIYTLSNSETLVRRLFSRIKKENQNDSIMFLKQNPNLEDKENVLLDGTELDSLNRFLQDDVPWVELTPDKCKDVQADKFEDYYMIPDKLINEIKWSR